MREQDHAAPVRHVFIVGLSRSGTTITRAVLDKSALVGIGGESNFLEDPRILGLGARPGFRDKLATVGDMRTEIGMGRVLDYVYSQQHYQYWVRLTSGLTRETFAARLRASDRSDRALLDIAMEFFAKGKVVRGDKTPHHIHSVPLLLKWFPDARIVHTLRDPRAVYASAHHKAAKEQSARLVRGSEVARLAYRAASVTWHWRRVTQLHREYESTYPNQYILSRFEDLITEPESTVRRLCAFIGVPFEPAMLDQVLMNSSFVPRGVTKGFDSSVLDRWRHHLSPLARMWFTSRLGAELVRFGYAP